MKSLLCILLLGVVACSAQEYTFADEDQQLVQPRTFNLTDTSSVLTLTGAVILLGVILYLVYVGGLLGNSSGYNRNGYEHGYYDPNSAGYQDQAQYAQYRSNDAAGYDFDVFSVLRWIQVLQEMYADFDYNDLECQKKIICEVMKEPEYYGSAAQKFKNGFRYARYLEAFSLPDDLRELLDEYLDANARSEQTKDCSEYFQCPYSIKDSIKRNVGNNL